MSTRPPLRHEIRLLLTLAMPLVAARVGHNLMGVADTIMAGRIHETAQATVGLGSTFHFAGLILAFTTLLGLDPVASQAVGAGRPDVYRPAFATARWLAIAFAVPTVVLQASMAPICIAFGYDPGIATVAGQYATIAAIGSPAALLYQVVAVYLTAHGHTRAFLWITIGTNVVNVFANVWFVWGGLGVPALGTNGLAVSTALCAWFQLGCGLWLLRESGPLAALRARWSQFEVGAARRVLALGVPVGVQYSLEMGAFALVTILMGAFGAEVLTAHQVALNLAAMIFVVALAMGSAGSVRVGQSVGRGDVEGAIVAGRAALLVGATWATAAGALMLAFAGPIARFYTPTADDLTMTVTLLTIGAWFQLADGVQAVGFGVLRGLGDTRVPAFFNIVGYWLIGVPGGAWIAFTYDAPRALWWGLTVALVLVAIALLHRAHRWSKRLRAHGVPC